MRVLLKALKKSILPMIFIMFLLIGQAICDLSLPDYTSNIVNIGIQQGGIEDSVPEALKTSEFNKLNLFLSDEENNLVKNSYYLKEKGATDEKLIKKYPILKSEDLYILKDIGTDERDKLSQIMAKSIMISSNIAKIDSKQLNEIISKELPPNVKIPEGTTVEQLISMMPKSELEKIKVEVNKKLEEFPESMIEQGATSYIREQYIDMGTDMDRLQNNYILKMGAIMLGIALISMVATVLVGYLGAKVSARLGMDLRGQIFKKVISFSNNEMDKFSTASLITRSTNDIQQIQMLMVMVLRVVFYAPILGVGGFIKVLNTDTSMAWIIGVALLSILSLVIVIFAIAMPKFKSLQKLVDKINLVTREILTGLLVIRAFNTEKHEEKRFENANKDLTKTNLFVNRTMVTMMPLMMLIMNLITILIVWNGSHAVDSGTMQVGNMMAFIQYTMQIIMSFLMISMVSIILPRAAVSMQRINEVIVTKEEIADKANTLKISENAENALEFKNVFFKYPKAEEYVLKDINFTVKKGETVAFIGGTGSGKSTLMNLIPRFYDISSGSIKIKDTDIRDVKQKELRDKIGYVPQKGILFSGTIESNLKYGNDKLEENELKKIADISMASEFINSKKNKFQSEISEGGSNLSGGQKQRLSIGRALAKGAEIYIFDDSFSALDFKTDKAIRNNLNTLMKESSLLIVAQRISTIINANQIIVLDDGEIVGKGTHKELMKNCEVYRQIALSQLSKEELDYE